MIYTIWDIPVGIWYIPFKSSIYHDATFQMRAPGLTRSQGPGPGPPPLSSRPGARPTPIIESSSDSNCHGTYKPLSESGCHGGQPECRAVTECRSGRAILDSHRPRPHSDPGGPGGPGQAFHEICRPARVLAVTVLETWNHDRDCRRRFYDHRTPTPAESESDARRPPPGPAGGTDRDRRLNCRRRARSPGPSAALGPGRPRAAGHGGTDGQCLSDRDRDWQRIDDVAAPSGPGTGVWPGPGPGGGDRRPGLRLVASASARDLPACHGATVTRRRRPGGHCGPADDDH
jgi:hypothetical protein